MRVYQSFTPRLPHRFVATLSVACLLLAVTQFSSGSKDADQRSKTATGRRPGWSDHLDDNHQHHFNNENNGYVSRKHETSMAPIGAADASMESRLKFARELALPYLSSFDRRIRAIEKIEHAKGKVPLHYSFYISTDDVQQMRVMLSTVENTNADSSPADVSKALANIHGLSSWWSMLVGNIQAKDTPTAQDRGSFFWNLTPSVPTAAFGVLIAQILLMLSLIVFNHWQVSFGRQILCAFVSIFVLSIPWNWLRLRERKQAEQLMFVNRVKALSAARNQCVRMGKREKVLSYLYSLVGVARESQFDECEEDTMNSYGTAEYQVSPIEAMWETTRQILIMPLEHISESLSKILRGLFSHLPITLWPLMTTIMAVVAIIVVLLFILRMFLSHGYRLRLPWFFRLEPTPGFLPHFPHHHEHHLLVGGHAAAGGPMLGGDRPQEAITHTPASHGWSFSALMPRHRPSSMPNSSSLQSRSTMEFRFGSGDHVSSQPRSYDDALASCSAAAQASAEAVRSNMNNSQSSTNSFQTQPPRARMSSAYGFKETAVTNSSATAREKSPNEFEDYRGNSAGFSGDSHRPNPGLTASDLTTGNPFPQGGQIRHRMRSPHELNKVRKKFNKR